MNHLTRHDYASALQLLAHIEAQAGDVDSFARATVLALHDYVASDLTTLSVCDVCTGRHQVVGLHGDDDLRTGLAYAMALPLLRSRRMLVSVVLHRRGLDFDARDHKRLELLRPHLAFLYQHACNAVATSCGEAPLPSAPASAVVSSGGHPPDLTLREGQVMHWLACGKTDAEIAALLSISPRTVQKHLEHVYVKLGVETRTAAVMRSMGRGDHPAMLRSYS